MGVGQVCALLANMLTVHVDHDSSPGEARGSKVDDTLSIHMLSRHLIHTTTARWQEGIPLVRIPQAPSTVNTQIIMDLYLLSTSEESMTMNRY